MKQTFTFIALLLITQIASANSPLTPPTNTPPPNNPPSTCEQVRTKLQEIHRKLYDVDTRPLAIEDYRAYRDGLQEMEALTPKLKAICNQGTDNRPETLYKLKHFSTEINYAIVNPCGGLDYQAAMQEFEASSIRECHRDGFRECTIKMSPRVFNTSGERNEEYRWTCKADMDLLLEAVRW